VKNDKELRKTSKKQNFKTFKALKFIFYHPFPENGYILSKNEFFYVCKKKLGKNGQKWAINS
jgi:hypothetical protein